MHEALAVASRVQLLDVLRTSGRPLSVGELARSCGLHISTVRFHLRILNEDGLVHRGPEPAHRRGRPRLLYTATTTPEIAPPDRYQALATMLAAHWAATPVERAQRAEHAGYAAATEQLGPPPALGPTVDEALSQVAATFADLGFAPELSRQGDDRRLELRACPFRAVAVEHPEVVCSLHLGLLRGALAASNAPATTSALMPFVEPDLCLALITPTPPQALGGTGQPTRQPR